MKVMAIVLLFLVTGTSSTAAQPVQAQLQVSAVVVARARLQAVDAASQVTVTAEDIARGYLDVSTSYMVRTNDPRGCLLVIAPRLGLTASIGIEGLPSAVTLRDDPVEVVLPGARGPQSLRLRVRLNFSENARPGVFDLPVHLAVSTL